MDYALLGILLITFSLFLFFIFSWYREHNKTNIVEKTIIASTADRPVRFKEMMAVVDFILNRNTDLVLLIKYQLPGIVFPYNFEFEVRELVKKTMNDLSPRLVKDLEAYVGAGYLSRYMTQHAETVFIKYIRDSEGKLSSKS